MPIFELSNEGLRQLASTNFAEAGVSERYDIQQHLRRNFSAVLPDVLVISEEFCDWDDSRRRIDLLGVDKEGNLVVIELKRTEDGGHMELQAVRYAAMVSKMTFSKAVEVFADYLRRDGLDLDAEQTLLAHLGLAEPKEDQFAQDVRIVLISADFGKELTTAVMWLNERDLNIKCIRLVPYRDDGRLLIDIQQIIPLPEAAEYQVRIREKEQKERMDRTANTQLKRFWDEFLSNTQGRCRLIPRASADRSYIGAATGIRGVTFFYVANRDDQRVELYIDRGDADVNKSIYDQLHQHKAEIEERFGGELSWQGLFGKRACRIAYLLSDLGNRNDEANWPNMQEQLVSAMDRFERAITPALAEVKV
ncbi:MAG: DUF4268 domain-containing protein [Acidobacteria bacterium]|nr:DUF4268 domain-containing protein [Acidobacteriota bacterium]